jgi:hypothetical protein
MKVDVRGSISMDLKMEGNYTIIIFRYLNVSSDSNMVIT